MVEKPEEKCRQKGERPDGLIPVYLDVGHKPDGSRIRKVFYGHTRAEALQKKEAFKTQQGQTALVL